MQRLWMYQCDEQEHGPVSVAVLKELAAKGVLQPTDFVWPVDSAKRVFAKKVKGLFPVNVDSSQQGSSIPLESQKVESTLKNRGKRTFWAIISILALLVIGVSIGIGMKIGQGTSGVSEKSNEQKSEWETVLIAMNECVKAKELFEDADDPSSQSKVKLAREASQHLENARTMVAKMPDDIQRLIENRIEAIVEYHEGVVTRNEAKQLGDSSLATLKLIDSQGHFGKSSIAIDYVNAVYPKLEAKYKKSK